MSFTPSLENGESSGESERHLSEAEREILQLQRVIHHVNERTALETEMGTTLNWNSIMKLFAFRSQNLKLEFMNQVPSLILTGEKIICEDSAPLQINLVDGLGQVVRSGPVAAAKVEIVALTGDFSNTHWTVEEFESKIQTEMKGRKSVLMNNVLSLKDGICFLSNLYFTHNAVAVRNCELRLGAKVLGDLNGTVVVEAKTEPFTLKDSRSKRRRKHDSLSPHDEVWRIKGIGINGPFLKSLEKENIKTVLDFLIQLSMDPLRLKQMHNGGDKKWAAIVSHARECKIDKKVYVYHSTHTPQNTCVVFNVARQVLGLLVQNQYVSINDISETEKVDAQRLVISAVEHSQDIVPFADENELINHLQLCADNEPQNSIGSGEIDLETNPSLGNLVYDWSIPSPVWLSPNSIEEAVQLLETCDNVNTLRKNFRILTTVVYFAVSLLKENKRTVALDVDAHISKKVRC